MLSESYYGDVGLLLRDLRFTSPGLAEDVRDQESHCYQTSNVFSSSSMRNVVVKRC